MNQFVFLPSFLKNFYEIPSVHGNGHKIIITEVTRHDLNSHITTVYKLQYTLSVRYLIFLILDVMENY